MKTFESIIDNLSFHLNEMLEELKASPLLDVDSIQNINGIYVFYEDEKAIYVGRTNKKRMKNRLLEHSKSYSNKNSATFAYLLTKEMKGNIEFDCISSEPDFLKAKERVRNMKVRIFETDDDIIQTILEPYFAIKLDTTKYNFFHTH